MGLSQSRGARGSSARAGAQALTIVAPHLHGHRLGASAVSRLIAMDRSWTKAAVYADGCQMRRLIDHPPAPPFTLNLAQVFRLIEQLFHAQVRIAGVLVDETAGVGH